MCNKVWVWPELVPFLSMPLTRLLGWHTVCVMEISGSELSWKTCGNDVSPCGPMVTVTSEMWRMLHYKEHVSRYRDSENEQGTVMRQSCFSLKWKCFHFDEIFITGCIGSCQNDNFQCSQWWRFHQNDDISLEVNVMTGIPVMVRWCASIETGAGH